MDNKKQLYVVTGLKSENVSLEATTTETHNNISIEVWATSEKEAITEALTQVSKCKTWLPDPATVAKLARPANPSELPFVERMAIGLEILATRYTNPTPGFDASLQDSFIIIGDGEPHGFSDDDIEYLHELRWNLVGDDVFSFDSVPF